MFSGASAQQPEHSVEIDQASANGAFRASAADAMGKFQAEFVKQSYPRQKSSGSTSIQTTWILVGRSMSTAMNKNEETTFTAKQEMFCREFMIDMNATQAAKRAGYSGSDETLAVTGHENLRNPKIAKKIAELMSERSKKTEITAEYVLMTIRDTIERCRQAVQVMEWNHDEKAMVPTGEWKFEHGGVLKGCELLGRHLKLFTDKVEHSGKLSLEDLISGSEAKEK